MDINTKALYQKEYPELTYFIERLEASSNNKILSEILEHKEDYKLQAFYLLVKEARHRGLIKYDTDNTVIILNKYHKQLIKNCISILSVSGVIAALSGQFALIMIFVVFGVAAYAKHGYDVIKRKPAEDSKSRIEEVDPFLEYRYMVTRKAVTK